MKGHPFLNEDKDRMTNVEFNKTEIQEHWEDSKLEFP